MAGNQPRLRGSAWNQRGRRAVHRTSTRLFLANGTTPTRAVPLPASQCPAVGVECGTADPATGVPRDRPPIASASHRRRMRACAHWHSSGPPTSSVRAPPTGVPRKGPAQGRIAGQRPRAHALHRCIALHRTRAADAPSMRRCHRCPLRASSSWSTWIACPASLAVVGCSRRCRERVGFAPRESRHEFGIIRPCRVMGAVSCANLSPQAIRSLPVGRQRCLRADLRPGRDERSQGRQQHRMARMHSS